MLDRKFAAAVRTMDGLKIFAAIPEEDVFIRFGYDLRYILMPCLLNQCDCGRLRRLAWDEFRVGRNETNIVIRHLYSLNVWLKGGLWLAPVNEANGLNLLGVARWGGLLK